MSLRGKVGIFSLVSLYMGLIPVAWCQTTVEPSGCGEIIGRLPGDASSFGHGILAAPRNAVRLNNLKWELPIAAAASALIVTGADTHVANHIQSTSLVNNSARASNIGVGLELGGAGLMYLAGCTKHRSAYLANTGWTALEAMGAVNVVDLGMKALLNRQYPYTQTSNGEFWEGGKSFPSGHAATSFAFASVVAHRYPHNWWVKLGAYGLATGVSLARVTGKKHYPSDVLIGGTLGYISGTYLVDHSGENSVGDH
jgi:membrane-associated phospholipid phosphatase